MYKPSQAMSWVADAMPTSASMARLAANQNGACSASATPPRHKPPNTWKKVTTTFAAEQFEEGTPQRLEHPGKADQGSPVIELVVGHAHALQHLVGDDGDGEEGQALCEVQGRHPELGIADCVFHVESPVCSFI
jgi:hypothetical protein